MQSIAALNSTSSKRKQVAHSVLATHSLAFRACMGES
jgi:hypothetical protein